MAQTRTLQRFAVWFACLLVACLSLAGGEIPPAPRDGHFVSDYANLIQKDVHQRIVDAQKTAFEQHNTPIIVVTISRMADYGAAGVDIKDFARQWFNQWRIGTLDAKEAGANKGVLLLVSVGDRKARIELGADWGRDWDDACQRIMDEEIIPQFKKGNFSEGIAVGVEKLGEMAAKGPSSPPPPPNLIRKFDDQLNKNHELKTLRQFNPYPAWAALLMFIAGMGCVVAGIFVSEYRKPLLIVGGILMLAGISIFLLILLVGVVARFMGGSRSGGGGSFGGYSGGGFSGGFSGGGGASGSW